MPWAPERWLGPFQSGGGVGLGAGIRRTRPNRTGKEGAELPESHTRALRVRPRAGGCTTSELPRYKRCFGLTSCTPFIWWQKDLGPQVTSRTLDFFVS